MYRILLVDDEWLELDTLEKYIPWEEMGFQVAGTAENGKEALQLLERLEGSENEEENDRKLPDVVLTDVLVPCLCLLPSVCDRSDTGYLFPASPRRQDRPFLLYRLWRGSDESRIPAG